MIKNTIRNIATFLFDMTLPEKRLVPRQVYCNNPQCYGTKCDIDGEHWALMNVKPQDSGNIISNPGRGCIVDVYVCRLCREVKLYLNGTL